MKSQLKNIALFAAAPFIGLLYAMAMPFVGLGMLGYLALRGKKAPAEVRDVAAAKIA